MHKALPYVELSLYNPAKPNWRRTDWRNVVRPFRVVQEDIIDCHAPLAMTIGKNRNDKRGLAMTRRHSTRLKPRTTVAKR